MNVILKFKLNARVRVTLHLNILPKKIACVKTRHFFMNWKKEWICSYYSVLLNRDQHDVDFISTIFCGKMNENNATDSVCLPQSRAINPNLACFCLYLLSINIVIFNRILAIYLHNNVNMIPSNVWEIIESLFSHSVTFNFLFF